MVVESKQSWKLKDWLSYLESIQPPKYKLDLANVKAVAKRLNLLDWDIPVITVAGTNGKGSTVCALNAIYTAAGFRVGHFTSPHLIKFNERICINDEQISDTDAERAMLLIHNSLRNNQVSYFEASLLCALIYFKTKMVDLLVLEVGIGGRLDATNIIDSDLAIITSIALDHQQYLGADLSAIAVEKAGIMRTDKPCVFADTARPQSIDEQAYLLNTKLICLGEDYFVEIRDKHLHIQTNDQQVSLQLPKINYKAAASAIIASQLLNNILPVTPENIVTAMQQVNISGRQQLMQIDDLQILFDVAHNPHAVELLADKIREIKPRGKIHAIFSGLVDKDLQGMLSPLLNLVDHWYPTLIQTERAVNKDVLSSIFQTAFASCEFTCFNNPVSALNSVTSKYQNGDLIVIYGSFILVGAIMEKTLNENSNV